MNAEDVIRRARDSKSIAKQIDMLEKALRKQASGVASALIVLHPNTTPIVSGRESCRKRILGEAYARVKDLVVSEQE